MRSIPIIVTRPNGLAYCIEREVIDHGCEEGCQEDGCCEKGREEELLKADDAGSPAYLALLEEMADLHRRKNAGYAGGKTDPWDNFRECEDFGLGAYVGVLVRIGDKWKRIKSLQRNPANERVGESKRDTLMDLAAYALIAVCLLDEERFAGE